MAPSEWTCSVRSDRDTLVADHFAPGVDSTHRVPYPRLKAVSPLLLFLSVSNFKRSLWRCGPQWPYVRMGSSGTRLHWDCNAMGDAVKISPRVPSSYAHNAILSLPVIHIIPSRQIYVAIDNPSLVPSVSCPTTSSYLWKDMRAADNVSHTEKMKSNGGRCFSHL